MLMIPGVRYTPLEQDLMNRLSDGNRHSLNGIVAEIGDDPTDRKAAVVRVSRLRKKLEGSGYAIICEYYNRGTHYRLVRLISQDE